MYVLIQTEKRFIQNVPDATMSIRPDLYRNHSSVSFCHILEYSEQCISEFPCTFSTKIHD